MTTRAFPPASPTPVLAGWRVAAACGLLGLAAALAALAGWVEPLTAALLALVVVLALTARARGRALARSGWAARALIENLGCEVVLLDRDGRVVAASPQFCRGLGRAEGEVIGRPPDELFDPRRAADVWAVLAEGTSVEEEEDRPAAGRGTVVRRVLTPVRDAAGRTVGVLGVCRDVTGQRLLEDQVHRAGRMGAIGQLAGGIAHDFNNLLTAILGNLDLILADPGAGDDVRDLAEAARTAGTRAAGLTRRLLGFARRHPADGGPADPNAIVEEVHAILRRAIDPRVRVETRCAPGAWPVPLDPALLNQVLMNLCLNARDAIGGAGRITVETACVPAARLPAARARAGDCVRLSVADTGGGMTAEVKARMFEPFFTTKGAGKGTGLGLVTTAAAVRRHGGWIDCWSEVGRGTRFDVYLPRAAAAPAAAVPPPPPADTPAAARPGRGRILVVDDEAMVRRVAAAALQARGYRVVEAADGQQAVDVYGRERDRIDLVLLDLSMPVLSGHETFRLLLQLDPGVRVLFASGYSAEQLSDLEREMMAGFVSKPYRPTELVAAVAEALGRAAGRPLALAAG